MIAEPNPTGRKTLKKALEKEGFKDVRVEEGLEGAQIVLAEGPGPKKAAAGVQYFTKPVRLGVILEALKTRLQPVGQEFLTFGKYRLNRLNYELLTPDDGHVRLTEKEAHILALLAGEAGKAFTRKEILDGVWGYAEGIETHTLETHIYRLRQKIEKDPANPLLLLTAGDGYRLQS